MRKYFFIVMILFLLNYNTLAEEDKAIPVPKAGWHSAKAIYFNDEAVEAVGNDRVRYWARVDWGDKNGKVFAQEIYYLERNCATSKTKVLDYIDKENDEIAEAAAYPRTEWLDNVNYMDLDWISNSRAYGDEFCTAKFPNVSFVNKERYPTSLSKEFEQALQEELK